MVRFSISLYAGTPIGPWWVPTLMANQKFPTPHLNLSVNRIVYPVQKASPTSSGLQVFIVQTGFFGACRRMLCSLVSISLSILFLHSISVCLVCRESVLRLKHFLACCRKERIFQEFWEHANFLEDLPETLLGCRAENNKTFTYLLKISPNLIVYLVGCGGNAYTGVLCLTVLSVYITKHRPCA